jgi:hypothetical protein
MSTFDPQILIGAGLFIGGMFGGIYSSIKLPLKKNGNGVAIVERSAKTGGSLHISEEGLIKLTEIRQIIEDKYLTRDKHGDICGKTQADIKLYISKALQKHTSQILQAIKQNGHGK